MRRPALPLPHCPPPKKRLRHACGPASLADSASARTAAQNLSLQSFRDSFCWAVSGPAHFQ
eukprot:4967547-Alexandrium_andersonii.AAC.1